MTKKKEILFLLQVALPFAILGFLKSLYFFIPVTLIVAILPLTKFRRIFIQGWQQLGINLGKLISPFVLGFLYYFILTPLAYLKKVSSSDALNLKRPEHSTLKTAHKENSPEHFDDLW